MIYKTFDNYLHKNQADAKNAFSDEWLNLFFVGKNVSNVIYLALVNKYVYEQSYTIII